LHEGGAIYLLGALIVSADCRFRHFPMNKTQILIHETGPITFNRQLDRRTPRLPSLQTEPMRCSRMGCISTRRTSAWNIKLIPTVEAESTQAEIQPGQFSFGKIHPPVKQMI
jgi:hypothetical protein